MSGPFCFQPLAQRVFEAEHFVRCSHTEKCGTAMIFARAFRAQAPRAKQLAELIH
jgi:hypothetical protein